ncbi:MAG: nucleotide excision repair endonuclease, partial [Peptostreptococcaceae bacterium]
MKLENCVYRFLDKNNKVIYVGKAKNLQHRLYSHTHLPKQCYEERKRIEFTIFDTEDDMDFAERYYIPKFKPKYNTVMVDKKMNIIISEFDNKTWIDLDEYYELKKLKYIKRDELKQVNKLRMNELKLVDEEVRVHKKYQREKMLKISEEIDRIKEENFKKELKTYEDKKVICYRTGEIFKDIFEFKEYMNASSSFNSLIDYLKGAKVFLDIKHPKYYGVYANPMLLSEFNNINDNIKPSIIQQQSENTRKIICLSTEEIFINKYEANNITNIPHIRIVNCCYNKS